MIIALSGVIQVLAIDRLHIIGDIFDRGPRADLIMDALENYHQVDVQWGNHDIAWMGAAALSEACIAQVIVTSVKYGNLETLEVGYGISLRPLATLAAACYADDPCEAFLPRDNGEELHEDEMELRACTKRPRFCNSNWKASCSAVIRNTTWRAVGFCTALILKTRPLSWTAKPIRCAAARSRRSIPPIRMPSRRLSAK